MEYLLKNSRANPMERNMSNNWVALHEAAFRDHYTCVNVNKIFEIKFLILLLFLIYVYFNTKGLAKLRSA